jgi:hypothetical protein
MRNSYLIGLYVDRKLVSSLRVQIGSATTPNFSLYELFPHVLEPLLRSNKTIVDMSCVATDGELAQSQSYDLLPYVVLRSWIIAAEHFNADYIAAAVHFVFVGFSDDRRLALVVRFGVVVFLLVIIIVIVGVSRRHRVAHDGDDSELPATRTRSASSPTADLGETSSAPKTGGRNAWLN